jgi:hypothetical protein
LRLFWIGFVFLIAFLTCLLLVFRRATGFCMLILYPATVPKVFIRSKSFFVESLCPLSIRSYHLQIGIIWLLSFLSFSCLISLAKNSSTIVNKSGENEHSCLVSDFRGNAFSFSPFSMVLTLLCWGMVFLFLISPRPFPWRNVEFYQRGFLHLLKWLCSFILDYIYVLYLVTYVHMLNHPCIPGMKPTWSWCTLMISEFQWYPM